MRMVYDGMNVLRHLNNPGAKGSIMMKRNILVCLMIIIVSFALPAFATAYRFPVDPAPVSEGELTMEAALTLAQNEMMQREEMAEIQLENFNCVHDVS